MNTPEISRPTNQPVPVPTEVISIGDELTSGQRLDTNSQWLSQQLTALGLKTMAHTTVADDVDAMKEAIRSSVARSRIVLITGGLGPTADDLTRDVIASVAKVELAHHDETANHVRAIFESRGREMPASNLVQAMFPRGARVIPNELGTAPGIDFTFDQQSTPCRLFAFPGVPSELRPMWHSYAKEAVREHLPNLGTIAHHSIHCFGLAESDVETRLPKIIERGRVPTVGITATKATITLRITAEGATEADCIEQIKPTAQMIQQELGELVFGENGQTLPDVVTGILRKQSRSFAITETGECLQAAGMFSSLDEAGKTFRGFLSKSWPTDLVYIPSSVECENVRRQMIDQARTCFHCDIVVWLGPNFTQDNIVKREVMIHDGSKEMLYQFNEAPNSAIAAERGLKQAMNFLRLCLNRREI